MKKLRCVCISHSSFKLENRNMFWTFCLLQITVIWLSKAVCLTEVDLPKPRLVVFGSSDVEKTTTSTFLLDCARDCLTEKFKICLDNSRCTKEVSYGVGTCSITCQFLKHQKDSLCFIFLHFSYFHK